jgi:hypothetical protein
MGIVGSMIAWRLWERGVSFTWDDKELPVNAWRASTGIIYPSGDSFDAENYHVWLDWANHRAPWCGKQQFEECVEVCAYWFFSKHPPHGGKYAIKRDIGNLRLASVPSIHFNAQKFVPRTRAYFAEQRVSEPPAGSQVVIAHGFDQRRLSHVLWGWTALVRLEFTREIHDASEERRPCLYLRQGRFKLAYAYPVPNTPYWYAGSHLIVQSKPKELEVQPKFETWKRYFAETTQGKVRLVEAVDFLTGWRPAAADGDTALVKMLNGQLVTKPLWSSGIRHSPLLVNDVLKHLGVNQ